MNLLKNLVTEICVKWIHINQGVGVSFKPVNTIECQNFFKMYLVLMSSSLERVWLERATLEAVKSEAWSLMSSAILCKGLRHELCI